MEMMNSFTGHVLVPLFILLTLASGYCAQDDSKITKEDVLNAIPWFRADPLSDKGRTAAAIVVRYVDKSHDVTVKIGKKTLPTMEAKGLSERERLALLSAFVIGNADSQLLRGKKGDDSYAGDLELIETYRYLQRRNPKLKVPEIERLIDLEKSGQLKKYVSSP